MKSTYLTGTVFAIIVLGLLAAFPGRAQTGAKECFEVKYLDFFGLDRMEDFSWSNAELDKLLAAENKALFLIPAAVRLLQKMHPACGKPLDPENFDRVVRFYFKLRDADAIVLAGKTPAQKIEWIRDDFYRLVRNDKILPALIYTTDDGPLAGETPRAVPPAKLIKQIPADFGRLEIAAFDEKILLSAFDRQNRPLWQRVMKGATPERYLRSLEFKTLEKRSLGFVGNFFAGGERLTLYLKPDGRFLFYYHSW
ncbi:MAG: hypothetical protein JSS81_20255 [Acidobacteria bacterium]|nr:hypothetical protein [Acidobacteriota bacterium]